LGVTPEETALFETTLEGIEAGRATDFGFIVAIERHGDADRFYASGVDLVLGERPARASLPQPPVPSRGFTRMRRRRSRSQPARPKARDSVFASLRR
jgi:hypothetical protein